MGPPFVMGPWKGSDTTAKVPRSMPRVCLSEHVQLRGLRPKDIGSNFENNTLSLALSLSLSIDAIHMQTLTLCEDPLYSGCVLSSPIRAELLFGSGFCPLSKRNEAQCDASSVPGRLLQRFLSPCASVQSTRSACLRLQRSRSGTGAKPLLGSVLQGFARRDRERGLRLDRSASPRSAARKPQGASQSPLAFGFRLGAACKRCARPGSVHASESGGVSRRAMLCHVLLRLLSGSSSRKPAWSLQLGVQNPRRWQDLTSSLTTIYRDLEKKATEGCRLPEPLETLRAEAAVEFIQGVEQRNTQHLICGTRKHSESPFGCASVSFWVRLCRLVPRTRQDSLVTETESPLAASRSLFPLRRSGVGNPAGPCGPRGPAEAPAGVFNASLARSILCDWQSCTSSETAGKGLSLPRPIVPSSFLAKWLAQAKQTHLARGYVGYVQRACQFGGHRPRATRRRSRGWRSGSRRPPDTSRGSRRPKKGVSAEQPPFKRPPGAERSGGGRGGTGRPGTLGLPSGRTAGRCLFGSRPAERWSAGRR